MFCGFLEIIIFIDLILIYNLLVKFLFDKKFEWCFYYIIKLIRNRLNVNLGF